MAVNGGNLMRDTKMYMREVLSPEEYQAWLVGLDERMSRLEKHAQVVCWRCLKTLPFSEAKIITYPTRHGGEEKILCFGCYSGYEDVSHTKDNESRDAIRGYLRELRSIKG
jgi:hypothetical protein